MDQVDIENDSFKLLAGGKDGVCINSLHVNNKQILVGKNNDLVSFEIDQPDQFEKTACLDYEMWTSSNPITLLHNDVEKATIPNGFKDSEYYLENDEVDIKKDKFKLLNGGIDGVSIYNI